MKQSCTSQVIWSDQRFGRLRMGRWLDATYLKGRQGGRIVSVAAIIAVAANTDGRREIIGLGLGPSEAETFWMDFLRGLKARGLDGPKLVISDAYSGLRAAIERVFEAHLATLPRPLDAQRSGACLAGAAYRRCRRDPSGYRPARPQTGGRDMASCG